MFKNACLRILFAALLFGSAAASAAPNLWWDHMDGGAMSKAACVGKGESILTSEKAGKISKTESSVRSWSERMVGVVECLPKDGGLMIMVLVASDEVAGGNVLFEALKKGMKP